MRVAEHWLEAAGQRLVGQHRVEMHRNFGDANALAFGRNRGVQVGQRTLAVEWLIRSIATGMALAPTVEAVAEATRRFIAGDRLRSARVLACTTCPVGEGRSVDAHVLGEAVARTTGLPCYDVQAGLRWIH